MDIWSRILKEKFIANEKAKLLCEKKTLEEKISTLEQKRTGWVEPMEKWIKEAENLPKIARESNLFAKKVAAKEIFGSNLTLVRQKSFRTELEKSETKAPNALGGDKRRPKKTLRKWK